ncbi:MAG TPA: hypothetical protein VE152_05640 [Acidimicrobiales bacterium]|nr:hypothetical protein [Acidimicrobiales bacterium]
MTLPLVDTSRSAELPGPSGALQARPRPLSTTVLYPARGPGGVVAGAIPLPGPRPLIVFAHGYDTAPARYGALLDAWARAGFVVAAPVFPLTSSRSARLDESDIVNQPGDVSFVISSLLARDHGGGPLAGLINPGAIGVAGHSDGGETVAAVSFDSAAQDPRVKATVVMAGAELHLGGGSYFTAGDPPVLVVQGTADRINNPALSTQLYDADPGPKYLLQLPGAGHWAPYTGGGAAAQVVTATTTAFFKAELLGDPRARSQILPDGQVAGVATIASANVG